MFALEVLQLEAADDCPVQALIIIVHFIHLFGTKLIDVSFAWGVQRGVQSYVCKYTLSAVAEPSLTLSLPYNIHAASTPSQVPHSSRKAVTFQKVNLVTMEHFLYQIFKIKN